MKGFGFAAGGFAARRKTLSSVSPDYAPEPDECQPELRL
jgi:hypothetical protein